MDAEAAEQTLRAVIGWARFAEAFAYDDQSQTFSLESFSEAVAEAIGVP